MNSNKILEISLIKKPEFRLDLSKINWDCFFENCISKKRSEATVIDGSRKKPFEEFFSVKQNNEYPYDFPSHFYSQENLDKRKSLKKIVFQGDLREVDFLGFKSKDAHILINGHVGNYVGCMMQTGSITIKGSAGHFVGAMMSGGTLIVEGDVGNYAGANLTGEMEGMVGGYLSVKGNAGNNFCRRMRRGFVFVLGDVGDFFANDMIAGSAVVGGTVGKLWGYGMRRGTIVFAKHQVVSPHVFKETYHDFSSYWGLLKPVIESFNGPFPSLVNVLPKRFVGDLAFGGKGECLLPRNTA
ncbi:MAG: formylmethanofuran dehydrogenase subunit C [Burkholderiaceae bacterium]|nr:MAG: formylmethanofuran dehydrogenase subunit C [Burkholderiaceae bacterium]